jgi:hypothetical protein
MKGHPRGEPVEPGYVTDARASLLWVESTFGKTPEEVHTAHDTLGAALQRWKKELELTRADLEPTRIVLDAEIDVHNLRIGERERDR